MAQSKREEFGSLSLSPQDPAQLWKDVLSRGDAFAANLCVCLDLVPVTQPIACVTATIGTTITSIKTNTVSATIISIATVANPAVVTVTNVATAVLDTITNILTKTGTVTISAPATAITGACTATCPGVSSPQACSAGTFCSDSCYRIVTPENQAACLPASDFNGYCKNYKKCQRSIGCDLGFICSITSCCNGVNICVKDTRATTTCPNRSSINRRELLAGSSSRMWTRKSAEERQQGGGGDLSLPSPPTGEAHHRRQANDGTPALPPAPRGA